MLFWEKKTYELIKNKEIYEKLKTYVSLILNKNKEFNLTGFDEEKLWLEGIYQSIFILDKFIDTKNVKLLDIGAGAGFPSIPYFIYKENEIDLTIYEPIKKRVIFLNEVIKKLDLKNIKIINKRIEDETKGLDINFVCARAVMKLKMLIEVSSKIFPIGTKYIFLKSKEAQNELEDSHKIISDLKINNIKINKVNLGDNKVHNIITYTKTSQTPDKYPRKWSEIKKNL